MPELHWLSIEYLQDALAQSDGHAASVVLPDELIVGVTRFAPKSLSRDYPMGRFPGVLGSTEIRMVEKKAPKRGRRSPVGDRRQFLTMMSPSVIKAVKQAGLEDDRPAWDIMEEAAKQWLERRKGKRNE